MSYYYEYLRELAESVYKQKQSNKLNNNFWGVGVFEEKGRAVWTS